MRPISTHEDSDGTGYCRGCGTTIGEEHHADCDLLAESSASTDLLACDCEKHAEPGFLTSGLRQEGETWDCPNCGKRWAYVDDEAEGGAWYPAAVQPTIPLLPLTDEEKTALKNAVKNLQAN